MNSTLAGSMASFSSTMALPFAGTVTVSLSGVSVTPALAKVLLTAMELIQSWFSKFVNSILRLAKCGSEISSRPKDSDTRSGASASAATTGVSMAWPGLTRPAPVRVSGYGAPFSSSICTAVFINVALMMEGIQPGCRSISNAAAPATCGAAIEVPPESIAASPPPANAEWMLKPGAEMSGLSRCVSYSGPRELPGES